MTELSEMAEAYKREVAVPGGFAAAFPTMSPTDIEGALADAFGEAQLDGFFGSLVLDGTTIDPDLSTSGRALVVLYAGMRTVRALIRDTKSRTKYEAKGVIYEVETGASVLAELLRDMSARKAAILALAQRAARAGGGVYVIDAYIARQDPALDRFHWNAGELPALSSSL